MILCISVLSVVISPFSFLILLTWFFSSCYFFIVPLVKWNVNFLVLGRKEISRPYKPFKFNCFKQIWSSSFLFSFYYNAFYTWIMWGWDKDAAALSGSHCYCIWYSSQFNQKGNRKISTLFVPRKRFVKSPLVPTIKCWHLSLQASKMKFKSGANSILKPSTYTV